MKYTRFVGGDVHAATIAIADARRHPATFEGTIAAEDLRAAPSLCRLDSAVQAGRGSAPSRME